MGVSVTDHTIKFNYFRSGFAEFSIFIVQNLYVYECSRTSFLNTIFNITVLSHS